MPVSRAGLHDPLLTWWMKLMPGCIQTSAVQTPIFNLAPAETTIRSHGPTSRPETQRLRPRIGAHDVDPVRAG